MATRDPPPHQLAAGATGRNVQNDQNTGTGGMSAQIREAKGLALELKGMLKRREPWDRTIEMQRENLRKTYLRMVFSPPPPSFAPVSGASALLGRTASTAAAGDPSLRARTSTPSVSPAAQHSTRVLELLNLLWLDTSHALIQSYRAKLSEMDKAIAAAPGAHKAKNRTGGRGNGGDVQPADAPAPPGPVARRKLLHQFRQFLGKEEDFWRTICGRMASRLYAEEALSLRAIGIVASTYSFSASDDEEPARVEGDDAFNARRAAVLPLAHKALICFGDLARYSELYSEQEKVPQQQNGRGGRGRGGKQNGGAARGEERKVKNFSRAAECYNQARLLLPDNGNPSNQLAVLSQYASDPLSSLYHYYRALAVRQPFTTAKANLEVSFKKAVRKWFAGGEPQGEEKEAFQAAFAAAVGVTFTKEHLADFSPLFTRTSELFHLCIQERVFTSDVVLKIVVTALSALWEARMTRSSVATKASSLAPGASSAALPASSASTSGGSTEPHLLLLTLSLYTSLLRASSEETNELFTSVMSSASPTDDPPPVAQLISAVLRRALPALRVLNTWLSLQMEYISRVEARVEASERRRARNRPRTSTGTDAAGDADMEADEAQRSLGTDASGGSNADRQRVSVAELRGAMDALWAAMADFGNSMLLAFPASELPEGKLGAGGVWLEEDVELLGFAPLRKGRSKDEGRPQEIRKVGAEVHPNEEQLMRVREGQDVLERMAASPISRFAFLDGAYVFLPRGASQPDSQPSDRSLQPAIAEAGEADAEMLDHATEDDPVDRAMRIDAAHKLDMDGLESDEYESSDDEDDEQIVFEGNRSNRASPAPNQLPPALPRATSSSYFTPSACPARTAADLRDRLLAGSPLAAPALSPSSGGGDGAFALGAPAHPLPPTGLARQPSSPAPFPHTTGQSIWGGSPLFGPSLSASSAAAAPPPQRPHPPVTPRSFESIPNVVHGSPAARQAGWLPSGANLPPPVPPLPSHFSAPPPQPAVSAATLFGGTAAFSPPPTSSYATSSYASASPFPSPAAFGAGPGHALPPPPGLGIAPPFAGGPFSANAGAGDGWPTMPGQMGRGNGFG
ncbi:hypothetical protein JCM10213_004884 [Rhodosporidiobolus nylandii]